MTWDICVPMGLKGDYSSRYQICFYVGTSTRLFRTIIRNFIDLWDIWGLKMSQRALGHLGVPKSFLCELGAKWPKLMRHAVLRKCPKLIESCRIHTQLCILGVKCAASCQVSAVPSR